MNNPNECLPKVEAYWGLKENFFPQRPDYDSKSFYLPDRWKTGLRRLLYLTSKTPNLTIVTSHAGHCKSTIANWIYHNLPKNNQQTLIFNIYKTQSKSGWLIPKLSHFFGGTSTINNDKYNEIITVLSRMARVNIGINIVIDDAHKLLTLNSLEEIKTLISIQTHLELPISFTLIGNHELRALISKSSEFKTRVNMDIEIPYLTKYETIDLLTTSIDHHKLNRNLISEDALESIYDQTCGRIGAIKNLVNHCLYEGYIQGKKEITSSIVQSCKTYIAKPYFEKFDEQLNPEQAFSQDTSKIEKTPVIKEKLIGAKKKNIHLENLFFPDED